MQINRQTYEEFFLLYIDNELDAEGRQAVETFAFENPDLAKELQMLKQAKIQPEQGIVFLDKKSLFKTESENAFLNDYAINPGNYEEYFTLYTDNELSAGQRIAVDDFVQAYPQYRGELELFKALKVEPDLSLGFPDKQSLYRKEKDRRFIPWGWKSMAAAAMAGMLLLVTAWYYAANTHKDNGKKQPLTEVKPHSRPLRGNILKEKTIDPSVDESGNKIANSGKMDRAVKKEIAANTEQPKPQHGQAKEKTTSVSDIAGIDKRKKTEIAQVLAKADKNRRKNERENPDTFIQRKIAATLIADAGKQQKIDTQLLSAPPLNRSLASVVKPAAAETTIKNKQEQKEIAPEKMALNANSRSSINEYLATDESALFYVANTSVSKKNRFRGLFRKASRIIERTAHISPSSGRQSIHIANLEIALQ